MIEVKHASFKKRDTYYDVNIIFKISKDDSLHNQVKLFCEFLVPQQIFLDTKYFPELTPTIFDESKVSFPGYAYGEFFLEYLEKFDVYQYRDTINKNTATKGIIKYLKSLCKNSVLSDNSYGCQEKMFFLSCLQSLNNF